MERLWDFIVRFRTWLIGIIGMLAMFAPELVDLVSELFNAPQIVAVLPESWRKWAGAIGFIALVWSRWRPASRAADPEVKVKKALKRVDDPAVVTVEAGGKTQAVIGAAK